MILLCCLAAYIDAGSITNSVPSVVAAVGGEVTLPCGIDDLGDAFVSWKKLTDDTNTPEIRIYHSKFQATPIGTDKYVVSAYSLTIKKLEIKDGGYYKCSVEGATTDVEQTAVIVVGTYTITQYVCANLIGAFTVHVVNGYICSNFSMFMYTFQVYVCVVACIYSMVWELGGDNPL